MRRSRRIGLSAQQVDPLSWFIGPLVPISLSALALIYGAVMSVITWRDGGMPWLQPLAVLVCAGSGVFVHVLTRPVRGVFDWRSGSLSALTAVLGVTLSAIGYAGTDLRLDLWWGSVALALSLATLAPYLPVRQLLAIGLTATLAATLASLAILRPDPAEAGVLGTAILIAYSPVLAVAASAVFAFSVVATTIPLLESPSRIMVAGQTMRDEVAQQLEEVTVARLTARAAPFLQGIADAGRITPEDRALAGQLARRMRDELVTQSNLTWLDSIADASRLVVVDPEHRARDMANAQRTALRGMLQAILDTPGADRGSLMVELRGVAGGATAVAVSLDMALPEGRKIMHLAPYVLTLGTAVDDLRIDSEEHLRLSFRVPAND